MKSIFTKYTDMTVHWKFLDLIMINISLECQSAVKCYRECLHGSSTEALWLAVNIPTPWKQQDFFFLFITAALCLRPPISDSVTISPFKQHYDIGETMRLSCQAGFIVTGQQQYTCGKDLSWIPPVLRHITCEKG